MLCRVLGPIEVVVDGEIARLRGQQAMLLAQLVASYPAAVPNGVLETAFWGDHPPAQADNAMRVAVTRLRNRLGTEAIEFSSAGYRLTLDAELIDSIVFETGVATAIELSEAAQVDAAYECVVATLAAWRGDPFATVADGFTLEPAIRKLSELHSYAEDIEVELLLTLGKFAQAAVRASETTTSDPLRERRWEHLMLALYHGGRSTEALRVFQQYQSFLAEEVGLVPGAVICELEQSIVQGTLPDGKGITPGSDSETGTGHARPDDGLLPHAPVPEAPSSYVLRDELASSISHALESARLVTVVGPPGVGKTRLAREYARSLDADDVWWIDLAVETPASAVGIFSEAFGVILGEDPLAAAKAVADRIGHGRIVVVVDNCEHVVAEVAPLLEALLAFAGNTHVLATSRRPLNTEAERVVRVGPMSSDEALRLLRQRTDPSRSVPTELAKQIVESVDCVPLAVEVIATRLRTRTPAELLSAGLTANDRSLRFGATFDVMLDADRQLFAALGVMAGSFDVRAAAHVFDAATAETRAGLDRLVEASLIELSTLGATPRYRLLQPMRELARKRLEDAGDLASRVSRHTEHFAATTVERSQALTDEREERAIAALDSDAAQIREAWRSSLDAHDVDRASMLAFSWWPSTLYSLRHRDYAWPYLALSQQRFEDSTWRVEVLAAAAMSESTRGRPDSAIRSGERAVALAAELGVATPREARFGLINSYGLRSRYDEAHRQLVSLMNEATERGDMYGLSGGQGQVALSFALLGMSEEATKQARAAMESAEASNNTSTLSFAHHAVALTQVEAEPQLALRHAYESIRLSNRVRNIWLTGWTTATLAAVYRHLERYGDAAQKLSELVTHWRSVKMEPHLVHTVLEAALLFDAVGDNVGVQDALTIANEGRSRHLLMPSDEIRAARLYRTVGTPAPGRDEDEQLDRLKERLEMINA